MQSHLQTESRRALLPAILDRAFKGELCLACAFNRMRLTVHA